VGISDPFPRPHPNQAEHTRLLRQATRRAAGLAQFERLADLGAGDGSIAREMAAMYGIPVLAIDRVPPRPHPSINPIKADLRSLPFQPGSVPAFTCHFVLHTLEDPLATLRHWRQWLPDGGVLVVLAEPDQEHRQETPPSPVKEAVIQRMLKLGRHPGLGGQLETLLRQAGFHVSWHHKTKDFVTPTPEEWHDTLRWAGLPENTPCPQTVCVPLAAAVARV